MMAKTSTKKGPLYTFALFCATCGFSGYFPIAPGTVGTAVAAGVYLLLVRIFGPQNALSIVLIAALGSIGVGIWAAGVVERAEGKKDPGKINIDEFAGFFISIILLPPNWVWAVIAFFVFRFFDIVKPWPIRRFEAMKGGFGIMIDDLVAGLFSLVVCHIIHIAACYFNLPLAEYLR